MGELYTAVAAVRKTSERAKSQPSALACLMTVSSASGIGAEFVDGNHDRYAVLLHVLNVRFQVADATLDRLDVFSAQVNLAMPPLY